MASAKVKYTDHTNQRLFETQVKAGVFLRNAASEVVNLSLPNTPRKTGFLRKNVRTSVQGLKAKIDWRMEYAGIQEDKQFRNYTTPGTGPHFAKNAVQKVADKTGILATRVGWGR